MHSYCATEISSRFSLRTLEEFVLMPYNMELRSLLVHAFTVLRDTVCIPFGRLRWKLELWSLEPHQTSQDRCAVFHTLVCLVT